ncbi:UxaA family hydrolase [Niveibacterium sp. SC-1]|uniref:UxaA family hydrolase n=1 Tax=Niveibacterium sp. SC-1 TaxID=3135646 RepID=UPI00311FF21B
MTLDASLLALRPDPLLHSFIRPRGDAPLAPPAPRLFRRADGRCGTRNFLGVVAMDPAAEVMAHAVVDRLTRSGVLEGLDGALPLAYAPGAALGSVREQRGALDQLLCARSLHPNLGALLLLDSGFPGAASRRCLRELQSVICDAVVQLSVAPQATAAFLEQASRTAAGLARAAARQRRQESAWSDLVFGVTAPLRADGIGAGLRAALARLVARGASVVYPQALGSALRIDAALPACAYGQRVVRAGWVPMAASPLHAEPAPGLVAAGAQLLIDAVGVGAPANAFSDAVPRLRLPIHRDADWSLARIEEALASVLPATLHA